MAAKFVLALVPVKLCTNKPSRPLGSTRPPVKWCGFRVFIREEGDDYGEHWVMSALTLKTLKTSMLSSSKSLSADACSSHHVGGLAGTAGMVWMAGGPPVAGGTAAMAKEALAKRA